MVVMVVVLDKPLINSVENRQINCSINSPLLEREATRSPPQKGMLLGDEDVETVPPGTSDLLLVMVFTPAHRD